MFSLYFISFVSLFLGVLSTNTATGQKQAKITLVSHQKIPNSETGAAPNTNSDLALKNSGNGVTPNTNLAAAICDGSTWSCNDPITYCGMSSSGEDCICDVDLDGNTVCWEDSNCDVFISCDSSSDCSTDSVCVSTCCFSGAAHCLPKCDTYYPSVEPTYNPVFYDCNGIDWQCGDTNIYCGYQNGQDCLCAQDLDNNYVCWQSDYCSNVNVCETESDCGIDEFCIPNTCCDPDPNRCLKNCGTNVTTPAPSQINNFCSNVEWSCGDTLTKCGESSNGDYNCYCTRDVDGNFVCFLDGSCTQPSCNTGSDCEEHQVCINSCCTGSRCFDDCDGVGINTPKRQMVHERN